MKDVIYLDNSATTALCDEAKAKMTESLDIFGNPSSLHSAGTQAEKLLREARRAILSTLGIKAMRDEHDKQLVFTSCGTEATSLALFGSAYAKKRREANRIITTDSEHPSVARALDKLAEDGFEIVKLSTRGGVLNADELDAALKKPIFMATLMLVNNETGALYDVKGAFDKIKRAYPDAICHCDAVQGYLKVRMTPQTLGADLITISAHKIHGPKGIGALYIAPHMITEKKISPFLVGGGQEHGMRSGTENVLGIVGFGAAASVGYKNMPKDMPYVISLRERAEKKLCEIGLALNIPQGARAPHVLNLTLPDIKSQTMLNFLSSRGIMVSSGSACSSHSNHPSEALLAFGLDAHAADCSLRVSLSAYNTESDIDALAAALEDGVKSLVRIKR
jgi:cysteine desulfurase